MYEQYQMIAVYQNQIPYLDPINSSTMDKDVTKPKKMLFHKAIHRAKATRIK